MDLSFFKTLVYINLIVFLSCEQETINSEEIYEENSNVSIITDRRQDYISGVSNVRLKITNFPKIWKLYLSIINVDNLSLEQKILLDTTSTQDQINYIIPWNTTEYHNGLYDLYTEIIDSSNNLLINTKSVYVKNYSIISIENKLEISASYQLDSLQGGIFSNSISHAQVETFFDSLLFDCTSSITFCGQQLLFNQTILPESYNDKISITPGNEHFFLKIKNNSDNNNHINTIIIKNGDSTLSEQNNNDEICENLSIPSDGQVYPIGYFSFNLNNYRLGNISVITKMDNRIDTTLISLYDESVLVDTVIVN